MYFAIWQIVMRYLLGLLVILVIADGLVTNYVITAGHGWEGNPFLRPLVGNAGFLVLKVAGALLSALILWDVSRRYRRLALAVTSSFVVFYGLIVLWNISVFAVF